MAYKAKGRKKSFAKRAVKNFLKRGRRKAKSSRGLTGRRYAKK